MPPYNYNYYTINKQKPTPKWLAIYIVYKKQEYIITNLPSPSLPLDQPSPLYIPTGHIGWQGCLGILFQLILMNYIIIQHLLIVIQITLFLLCSIHFSCLILIKFAFCFSLLIILSMALFCLFSIPSASSSMPYQKTLFL